jgi:hypothetical protein
MNWRIVRAMGVLFRMVSALIPKDLVDIERFKIRRDKS